MMSIKEESILAIIINAVNQSRRATVYEMGCEILAALPEDLAERDLVKAIILQRMDSLMSDGVTDAENLSGKAVTGEPAGAGGIWGRTG